LFKLQERSLPQLNEFPRKGKTTHSIKIHYAVFCFFLKYGAKNFAK
jgi:hypothetical protein